MLLWSILRDSDAQRILLIVAYVVGLLCGGVAGFSSGKWAMEFKLSRLGFGRFEMPTGKFIPVWEERKPTPSTVESDRTLNTSLPNK